TVDLEEFSDRRRIPVQAVPQDALDLIAAQAEWEGAELAIELERDPEPTGQISSPPIGGEGGSGGYNEPSKPPLLASPPSGGEESVGSRPTYSGTITVTTRRQRVVVDNIAPEDILFTPTARDQDKASFLGFRKKVTASDLVEMGLSPAEVDTL